jgi:hypothetical protein
MVVEVVADSAVRRLELDLGVTEVRVGADHVARVEVFGRQAGLAQHLGHDPRRVAFAEADDEVERARRGFADEEHAVEDIVERPEVFFQRGLDRRAVPVVEQLGRRLEVAFAQERQARPVRFVSASGAVRQVDQRIGYFGKSGKDDGQPFAAAVIIVQDHQQLADGGRGTDGRAAELQDFHRIVQAAPADASVRGASGASSKFRESESDFAESLFFAFLRKSLK